MMSKMGKYIATTIPPTTARIESKLRESASQLGRERIRHWEQVALLDFAKGVKGTLLGESPILRNVGQ